MPGTLAALIVKAVHFFLNNISNDGEVLTACTRVVGGSSLYSSAISSNSSLYIGNQSTRFSEFYMPVHTMVQRHPGRQASDMKMTHILLENGK